MALLEIPNLSLLLQQFPYDCSSLFPILFSQFFSSAAFAMLVRREDIAL
jgi:hypothetical protein